jgi:hypothetical protein
MCARRIHQVFAADKDALCKSVEELRYSASPLLVKTREDIALQKKNYITAHSNKINNYYSLDIFRFDDFCTKPFLQVGRCEDNTLSDTSHTKQMTRGRVGVFTQVDSSNRSDIFGRQFVLAGRFERW